MIEEPFKILSISLMISINIFLEYFVFYACIYYKKGNSFFNLNTRKFRLGVVKTIWNFFNGQVKFSLTCSRRDQFDTKGFTTTTFTATRSRNMLTIFWSFEVNHTGIGSKIGPWSLSTEHIKLYIYIYILTQIKDNVHFGTQESKSRLKWRYLCNI